MSELLSEKLSQVACKSLEQLAFLCPFPSGGDENFFRSSVETVQVQFTGPFSGELFVILSSSALPELASNMLGLDPEDETAIEQQRDALSEATNVVCGNLLPKIAGGQAVFDLKAPQLFESSALAEVLSGREADARVVLELEEGRMELILLLQDGWEKSVAAG